IGQESAADLVGRKRSPLFFEQFDRRAELRACESRVSGRASGQAQTGKATDFDRRKPDRARALQNAAEKRAPGIDASDHEQRVRMNDIGARLTIDELRRAEAVARRP